MVRRLRFIIVIGILAVAVGLFWLYRKPRCERCNIVLFDIDVLRADALPCMGYSRNTVPHMCRLAKESIVFTRNVSQSYWTLTSMISTITSLYPSAHQFTSFYQTLHPAIETMAQVLKSRGYTTLYHGTPTDTDIAYDNRAIEGYDDVSISESTSISNWPDSWVQSLRKVTDNDQPFFLHYYSSQPHIPYLLPDEEVPIGEALRPPGFPLHQYEFEPILKDYIVAHYRDIFTDSAVEENPNIFRDVFRNKEAVYNFFMTNLDDTPNIFLRTRSSTVMNAYLKYIRRMGTPAISYMRLLYDTLVFDIDRAIGAVIDELRRTGTIHNTIIIISSSHGEEFGEHGNFSHEGGNYNELIHTPLVMFIPGQPARIVDQVTQNVDILPTVMDLLGFSRMDQFQGTSLFPLIRGDQIRGERYAVSEFHQPNSGASIQSKQWKLIVSNISSAAETVEFYNLINDPREINNIAQDNGDRVKEYRGKLDRVLSASRRKNLQSEPPRIPSWIEERTRERLKRGGYF